MSRQTEDYATEAEARIAGLILVAGRKIEASYMRETEDGAWYIDDEPPALPEDDEFFTWG